MPRWTKRGSASAAVAGLCRRGRLRVRDGRAISRAGSTELARIWLFLAYLAMPLKTRLPRLDRALLRLPVRVASTNRRISVADWSEMVALKEILVEGIYDVRVDGPVSSVVDLGANVGVATLYFRARWPSAHVIAVEPDPATFQRLRANLEGVAGVTLVHAAVIGADAQTVDFASDTSSWTSRVASPQDTDVVAVPAVTLDDLVERFGLERIDVLKLDVEGMEYEIVARTKALGRVGVLVGEVHPVERESAESDLLRALVDAGWRWQRPFEHHIFCLERSARRQQC